MSIHRLPARLTVCNTVLQVVRHKDRTTLPQPVLFHVFDQVMRTCITIFYIFRGFDYKTRAVTVTRLYSYFVVIIQNVFCY